MPLNLRGEGTHPEIGIVVDNKGVARDAKTGQSLGRSEVDARIAGFQTKNPGTEVYGLEKKRGGLAGTYDRNKAAIPAIQTAVAMLPGIGPLASAAMGAVRGFDRPGQGGIGYDVKTGLKGAATGYAAGMTGNALAGGLGKAAGAYKTAGGGLGGLGAGIKSVGSSMLGKALGGQGSGLPGLGTLGGLIGGGNDLLGGSGGGGGSTGGDVPAWMKALAVAQGANAAALGKKSGDLADKAMDTQNDLWSQRSNLRSQGIAGMQAAPVTLPQMGAISQSGNPFARVK